MQTHQNLEDFFSFSLFDFCSTSGIATMCQEPKEFRVRGRNVTIAEAWLLCRKHRPTRQTCQWTALGKRSQGTVCGGEQKGWCTVELVWKRIPHLQSFWISGQDQQLVINWEHYWQPRKTLWSASCQTTQNSGLQINCFLTLSHLF